MEVRPHGKGNAHFELLLGLMEDKAHRHQPIIAVKRIIYLGKYDPGQ
jgi:hypothetical protein